MRIVDAVTAAGTYPGSTAGRAEKKNYSESLSHHLARAAASGLRRRGFAAVPEFEGPGERRFQGGLGPKKVDVSVSDSQHGLQLAVSIKTISFAPFSKNLKNRFSDLTTEAITLHMRFPYAVVAALFAFPEAANERIEPPRPDLPLRATTFHRAARLLATVSGRESHTDAPEKFELVHLVLFRPLTSTHAEASARIFNALTFTEISEEAYFQQLTDVFYDRNPHLMTDAD